MKKQQEDDGEVMPTFEEMMEDAFKSKFHEMSKIYRCRWNKAEAEKAICVLGTNDETGHLLYLVRLKSDQDEWSEEEIKQQDLYDGLDKNNVVIVPHHTLIKWCPELMADFYTQHTTLVQATKNGEEMKRDVINDLRLVDAMIKKEEETDEEMEMEDLNETVNEIENDMMQNYYRQQNMGMGNSKEFVKEAVDVKFDPTSIPPPDLNLLDDDIGGAVGIKEANRSSFSGAATPASSRAGVFQPGISIKREVENYDYAADGRYSVTSSAESLDEGDERKKVEEDGSHSWPGRSKWIQNLRVQQNNDLFKDFEGNHDTEKALTAIDSSSEEPSDSEDIVELDPFDLPQEYDADIYQSSSSDVSDGEKEARKEYQRIQRRNKLPTTKKASTKVKVAVKNEGKAEALSFYPSEEYPFMTESSSSSSSSFDDGRCGNLSDSTSDSADEENKNSDTEKKKKRKVKAVKKHDFTSSDANKMKKDNIQSAGGEDNNRNLLVNRLEKVMSNQKKGGGKPRKTLSLTGL